MSADAALPLDVTALGRVTLAEVLDTAAALHRVDRKYLVDRATATALLEALPSSYRVLTIAGRSLTTYRSTYFDTPDLATARAHVQKRRRRWKARSRLYVEDGLCRVEVKTKDGRGGTVKTVADLDAGGYGRLDPRGADFVRATLEAQGITDDVSTLRPSMEVRYRRTTLADTVAHERVTLDWGVHCDLAGDRVWLDDDCVLVETKSGIRLSPADRALHALGARPRSFSKYVAAATLLRDDLPDNDVRRLHGRLLHSARLLSEEKATA
ncbi:MAG: polyphosphate polymerase domain-containing protein [Nocardioides sp.]